MIELTEGVQEGTLVSEFLVWADGSRVYSDYVFRGVCKSAKLPWEPEGPESDDQGA